MTGANPVAGHADHQRLRRRDVHVRGRRARDRHRCRRSPSAARRSSPSAALSVELDGGAVRERTASSRRAGSARPAQQATRQGPGADHRRGRRDGRLGHAQLLAGDRRRPTRTSWTPTRAAARARRWRRSTRRRSATARYIIDLTGTDSHGNQQDNELLVTVAGDYKPGREVVDQTEFTVALAGLPITVGRRYDSLNKDQVGDFGNGWSLDDRPPRPGGRPVPTT